MGPAFLKDKCFITFLGDPWAKHLEGLYKAFIFYPTSTPLGLQPLLGSIHPKIPRDKEMQGNNDGKWQLWSIMVIWLFKGVPSSKPIPKENHLLGHNVNHQGEAGKRHNVWKAYIMKSRKI